MTGRDPRHGRRSTHRYRNVGTYNATLTARDGRGGEDTATVRIDVGNTPPVPRIDAPSPTATFSVGQSITLSGSATDAEDGVLPGSSLTWIVERHHDTHTHPFLPPTTGSAVQIVGPEPEDLSAAPTSHLELTLTATDSSGLSRTVTQDLQPHLVNLTFATDPPGLHVLVNETELTSPQTVTSWDGWRVTADAPDQADGNGANWRFSSWSDGGPAAHQITTPGAAATYTARFASVYARPKGATPVNVSLVPAFEACAAPDREHGPPLDEPSCAPPVQTSPRLTVGSPDANALAAQSTGALRLDAVLDDPGTSGDDSDILVRVSITDVRHTGDLSDYTSELDARLFVRLTDRANGGAANEAGTISDTALRLPVQCTGTANQSIGATCALATTLNSVLPGAVAQGRRSIWALDKVEVYDGGPDGLASTSTGNTLFETQGVFVP